MRNHYRYIISGAGCAGLSLCFYLLERGVTEPILLLDRKRKFTNDRTWCFWDVEPTPFTHLAKKRWSQWRVVTAAQDVSQASPDQPYVCLPSDRFYDYILEQIGRHPNVTLQLGETVLEYTETAFQVELNTDQATYIADYFFDARNVPANSALAQQAKETTVWIPQQFVGHFIKTQRPVFDPTTCTLMDFRIDQNDGIHFEYVLPFSPTEALVEDVYMTQKPIPARQHRHEIAAYMRSIYNLTPADYTVTDTERGIIPMTDFAFPRQQGQRIFAIGTLGGQTRASSGYTFLRIQRYCRQLVDALLDEGPLPDRLAARRLDILDSIFLRFMASYPDRCPDIYSRMFSRVPTETLTRFLSDRSSLLDELRLMAALPKWPFIQTTLGMLSNALSSRFKTIFTSKAGCGSAKTAVALVASHRRPNSPLS